MPTTLAGCSIAKLLGKLPCTASETHFGWPQASTEGAGYCDPTAEHASSPDAACKPGWCMTCIWVTVGLLSTRGGYYANVFSTMPNVRGE